MKHLPRAALLGLVFATAWHAVSGAAAPVEWIGEDGAWEDAANWSGAAVPTASDFVTINHTGAVSSSAAGNVALELVSHAALTVAAGQLSVTGTIDSFGSLGIAAGATGDFGRIFVQASGALVVDGPGATVSVTEGVFSSGDWQLHDAALLEAESFDNFATVAIDGAAVARANSMINHAGTLATIAAGGSELDIAGNLTNAGEMRASAGGTLRTVSVDNGAVIAIDGGHFVTGSLDNQGSVDVRGAGATWNASDVVTNDGDVALAAGANATLATLDNFGQFEVDAAGATLTELDNHAGATLGLRSTSSVAVTDLALNRGVLEVDAGAALLTDRFQQLDGTTLLAGGTLGASSPLGVDVAGGTLGGRGVIDGALSVGAGGILDPGEQLVPVGRFDVLGDLSLAGLFRVDLGSAAPGGFDQLDADGAALLGGTLQVGLVNGFVPTLGDYFDIVLAASIGGDFADLLLPALPAGLRFSTVIGSDFYRLAVTAVPLPAPLLPVLAMLTLLARWRRRRV
ncbi:MAG: hypothetical protein RKL32_02550 [Gammaproteobacteria bacterium]